MPHMTSKYAEKTIEYEGIRYVWREQGTDTLRQGWFVVSNYSRPSSKVEERLNAIARQLNKDDPYRWQNVLRFVSRSVLLAVPAIYAFLGVWFPIWFDRNQGYGLGWAELFIPVLWIGIVFANASVTLIYVRLKEPARLRSPLLENLGQLGSIVSLNLLFFVLVYWATLLVFAAVNQRWSELRNWGAFFYPCLFSIPLILVSMLVNWLIKHKSRWL